MLLHAMRLLPQVVEEKGLSLQEVLFQDALAFPVSESLLPMFGLPSPRIQPSVKARV